jgi:hypothetical protein
MPKRSSKSGDLNRLAAAIVDEATAEDAPAAPERDKDPAAVSLGRRGGLKGGKARAKALSNEQKTEIAKKAAGARWAAKRRADSDAADPKHTSESGARDD